MVGIDEEPGPLLTNRQREHLQGEAGVEPGSPADRSERSRIRTRLRRAILDFRFLFEHTDQDLRDSLVDLDAWERAQLHDGMVAAVGLFYEIHEREGWPFADLLERMLEDVYDGKNDRSPEQMIVENVTFDKSLKSPREREEIERAAISKFTQGYDLTDREYRILTEPEGWIINPETGLYLDREEILEALRERRKERNQERRQQEALDTIEKNVEMFGSGYQLHPDYREERDGEE